jgi:hypothetical protein
MPQKRKKSTTTDDEIRCMLSETIGPLQFEDVKEEGPPLDQGYSISDEILQHWRDLAPDSTWNVFGFHAWQEDGKLRVPGQVGQVIRLMGFDPEEHLM